MFLMRKIISKREEERRRRRNQYIVGGVMISIMFFSVFGFSFYGGAVRESDEENTSQSERVEYNGFIFSKSNGFWILNYENLMFAFLNNPEQTEDMGIEISNLNIIPKIENYYEKPLYIYSENELAEIEIESTFYPFVENVKKICTSSLGIEIDREECEEKLINHNCDNNSIIIRERKLEDNEEKIIVDGNCIHITGEAESLIKLVDEFLFITLRIKN